MDSVIKKVLVLKCTYRFAFFRAHALNITKIRNLEGFNYLRIGIPKLKLVDLTIWFCSATVNQLIMEKLPNDARISTNSKDMIIQLCMTFLTTLAAKANNVCGAKNKKTVCPDHVIDAMVVSL